MIEDILLILTFIISSLFLILFGFCVIVLAIGRNAERESLVSSHHMEWLS